MQWLNNVLFVTMERGKKLILEINIEKISNIIKTKI